MKTILLLLTALALPLAGRDVKFAWHQNPEPDVAYYEMAWGEASGHYSTFQKTEGTKTAITISGFEEGKFYWCAVRAVNTSGLRSAFSAELVIGSSETPPSAPSAPFIVPIEVSADLKTWTPVAWVPLPQPQMQFVRASIQPAASTPIAD